MNNQRFTTSATGAKTGASRSLRGHLLASALLAGAGVHLGTTGVAWAGAIVQDPPGTGCNSATLPASDDGATGLVPIGFPVNLSGNIFSQLHVDTNGFVLFNATPPAIFDYPALRLDTTAQLLIAPFLSDVDTRNPGSDLVTYGQTTFGSRSAFCVSWGGARGVGYFDAKADKLNRFQLLLVDRSDQGIGDIDIIMNYDQIAWDEPEDCIGGVCPTFIGFSTGVPGSAQILAGPAAPGELLDSNTTTGLVNGTNGVTLGRYTFAVRNGIPPADAAISGTIYDPNGLPLAGAPVQACPTDGTPGCVLTVTNGLGNFTLEGFDPLNLGIPFTVTASAPAGEVWLPVPGVDVVVTAGAALTGTDFTLGAPVGIPVGTTVSPSTPGGGGVPTVFWGNPLTFSTHGCPGGTAAYAVTQGAATLGGGSLVEAAATPGLYTVTIPPFAPSHGYATITINLSCPGGESGSSDFNIYIDPSGKVHNTHGAPIEGATMTLFRSDSPFGPFESVASGSAIMSPSNRLNPSFTDATGFFGWDVIAGYYVVRAEKAGCTSPFAPAEAYVETALLQVPAPVTDLDLILDCGAVAPPAIEVPGSVIAKATSSAGAAVTYAASAIDSADGPVAVGCAPPAGSTFPLGTTAVVCSATNSAGNSATATFNVTVVYDSLTLLPPINEAGSSTFEKWYDIPVQFTLNGASAEITDAPAQLFLAQVQGGVVGAEQPALPSGHENCGNLFHFSVDEGLYTYLLSTDSLTPGAYQLRIDLGDGVLRTALFTLTGG